MSRVLSPFDENFGLAVERLCSDFPVAFPTETVYGLGGNAYSDSAVAKIFVYKNRPQFNPLSVCYKDIDSAGKDLILPKSAVRISMLLPGPITVVLRKRSDSRLSKLCSLGLDTVGLRIPDNGVALKLLFLAPFPLAAPSANKSGGLSPVSADSVASNFSNVEDLLIIDGGRCRVGIESTIIDCSRDDAPRLLRLGAVSVEKIEDECGVKIYKNEENLNKRGKLASSKPVLINVTGGCAKSDAILAFGNVFENDCKHVLNLSESGNVDEAAANFFHMLEVLEKSDADRICVMPIPNLGIGAAINDRLQKIVAG